MATALIDNAIEKIDGVRKNLKWLDSPVDMEDADVKSLAAPLDITVGEVEKTPSNVWIEDYDSAWQEYWHTGNDTLLRGMNVDVDRLKRLEIARAKRKNR